MKEEEEEKNKKKKGVHNVIVGKEFEAEGQLAQKTL
jgi:hypothetical protein